MLKKFILTFLICSSLLLAGGEERSTEDIKKEAQEHFEDAYDKAALGGAVIGVGILQFSGGQPVAAATSVGVGFAQIKQSFKDFKKASDLFADAREQESSQENFRCDDSRDNVDSWDHDY